MKKAENTLKSRILGLMLLPLASALVLNGCYTVPLALVGGGLFGLDTMQAKQRNVGSEMSFDHDFQTVWLASLETMKELGIRLREGIVDKKNNVATIKGATPRFKNITILAKAVSPVVTRVEVKVRDDEFLYRPLTRSDVDPGFQILILQTLNQKLANEAIVAMPKREIAKGELCN